MYREILNYTDLHDDCKRIRKSARGIVIKDNKILLVKNTTQDIYMLPGGGLEDGETLEECCVRELLEETGYICKVVKATCEVEENFENICFLGRYFICEIIGTGEKNLTEQEKEVNCVVEWTELNEAIEMFAGHSKYKDYWEKDSTYLREHMGLKHSL